MRKLKAALCAVIGDDSDKIEKAKEIYRDQACIHIHEHGEEGESEECHHHEENNFFNFLMKYELEEKYKIKGNEELQELVSKRKVELQELVSNGLKRSFTQRILTV